MKNLVTMEKKETQCIKFCLNDGSEYYEIFGTERVRNDAFNKLVTENDLIQQDGYAEKAGPNTAEKAVQNINNGRTRV